MNRRLLRAMKLPGAKLRGRSSRGVRPARILVLRENSGRALKLRLALIPNPESRIASQPTDRNSDEKCPIHRRKLPGLLSGRFPVFRNRGAKCRVHRIRVSPAPCKVPSMGKNNGGK